MKKGIEIIKELKKTPKGKAVLFFGGYLIFFIIVILFVRFSTRSTTLPSDYEKGKSSGSDISIDKLVENNYLFTYKIILDGKEYIYNGKRNKFTELFQYNDKTYYKNDETYFSKNSDLWVKVDNPYMFSDFIDSSKIISIIEMASLESKTTYEDGRSSINMLISTNTLNQKLNNIDSDFFKGNKITEIDSDFYEEPNKITLIANKNKDINEINYDLSSYCTLNKLCQSSLKINLSYEMYGEIKNIENPVNE